MNKLRPTLIRLLPREPSAGLPHVREIIFFLQLLGLASCRKKIIIPLFFSFLSCQACRARGGESAISYTTSTFAAEVALEIPT